jgi:hypothetical protein
MPAHVVLVHDDIEFLMAFDALKGPASVDVLVTRDQFRPGQPPGVALARVAHVGRHALKVIFTAQPETTEYIQDYGRVFPTPVPPDLIVQAVEDLLGAPSSA